MYHLNGTTWDCMASFEWQTEPIKTLYKISRNTSEWNKWLDISHRYYLKKNKTRAIITEYSLLNHKTLPFCMLQLIHNIIKIVSLLHTTHSNFRRLSGFLNECVHKTKYFIFSLCPRFYSKQFIIMPN